jgi:hypothetical protein
MVSLASFSNELVETVGPSRFLGELSLNKPSQIGLHCVVKRGCPVVVATDAIRLESPGPDGLFEIILGQNQSRAPQAVRAENPEHDSFEFCRHVP